MKTWLVVAAAVGTLFTCPPVGAVDPAGQMHFVQVANSSFDAYTQNPTQAQKDWMRAHYWRMLVYSPYFDTRLSWFPDGWVYKDLYAIYPDARGIVSETILLKLPRMLPYAAPGRAALQPALERPLGRIHLAGDYLGGVYTDTAISSGQEAALAVRAALQATEA